MWDSAPELAGNQTASQHVFLVVNSFLQLDFIITMIHALICQICSLGSVVRTLRCTIGRLPVLIQKACFSPGGERAWSLFKSSESKLTLTNKLNSPHSQDLREARAQHLMQPVSIRSEVSFCSIIGQWNTRDFDIVAALYLRERLANAVWNLIRSTFKSARS